MPLAALLDGIAPVPSAGLAVTGLTLDSCDVNAGDAFIALAGAQHHGVEFARDAIKQGAVVVLAEKQGAASRGQGQACRSGVPLSDLASPGLFEKRAAETSEHAASTDRNPTLPAPCSLLPAPTIWVDHLRAHLGVIAARFYGDPSATLTVVGVTGTSGKTSTVQLLAQAFTRLGRRVATIGTLGVGLHGALRTSARTTPDVIRVQRLLAEFRDAGATHVAMEVSSHALDQQRVDGVHFAVAVFTNLTRDHLDYHRTMEAYGAAKAKLFAWPTLRAVVINVDDAFGRRLVSQATPGARVLRCAIESPDADVRARDIHTHSDGLEFELATPWGAGAVRSQLLGRFNVANLLAVAGVLGVLDVPFAQIMDALAAVQPVAGRMNRLGGGTAPLVVVDYSHKPDPLEQVLKTLREHCAGKLTCVFGCGGERDAGKRPQMGAIAERLADRVIVTDDNPRGEDGDAIVAQIVAGMRAPERARIERDRACAIGAAIAQARAGDIVLIAGKGHETYQEIAGTQRPFSDLAVARAALEARAC